MVGHCLSFAPVLILLTLSGALSLGLVDFLRWTWVQSLKHQLLIARSSKESIYTKARRRAWTKVELSGESLACRVIDGIMVFFYDYFSQLLIRRVPFSNSTVHLRDNLSRAILFLLGFLARLWKHSLCPLMIEKYFALKTCILFDRL